MKINKIELYNFGSYEDYCVFDLSSNDPAKKIVVIGGKNGAGKTTLFTAIEVCLYGHYAFGYKIAGKFYFKTISELINRNARIKEDMVAYIRISFSQAEGREHNDYTLERRWHVHRDNLQETMTVWKNDVLQDTNERRNFQNYLLHLIPPDMLKLYFFDGEKIADYFFSDAQVNIRDALMVLSGNDTFDILYNNVKRVLYRDKNEQNDSSERYLKCQRLYEESKSKLEQTKEQRQELLEKIDQTHANLDELKEDYKTKGGITLQQWQSLQADLTVEEELREQLNRERKQLAAEVLPFIILKKLVAKVLPQINDEEAFRSYKILENKLTAPSFIAEFEAALSEVGLSQAKQREQVLQHLNETLLVGDWDDYSPLFSLSQDETIRVSAIVQHLQTFNTNRFSDIKNQLTKSIERSKLIRGKIKDSNIEHLSDFVRQTTLLEGELEVLSTKLEHNELQIVVEKEDLETKTKILQSARDDLKELLKQESVKNLSSRVLLLLEDLQEHLYTRLIAEVERCLKYKLDQLISKADFFDDIRIDQSFNVHLFRNQEILVTDLQQMLKIGGTKGVRQKIGDLAYQYFTNTEEDISYAEFAYILSAQTQDRVILPVEFDKDRLSSGEKQIFVMALYWALIQQSEQNLPYIIDTPFARIDTEHRSNIVEYFFKDLPGQLFILSTNEEINRAHLASMDEQIAHMFTLQYGVDQRTYIHENHFFEVS